MSKMPRLRYLIAVMVLHILDRILAAIVRINDRFAAQDDERDLNWARDAEL